MPEVINIFSSFALDHMQAYPVGVFAKDGMVV